MNPDIVKDTDKFRADTKEVLDAMETGVDDAFHADTKEVFNPTETCVNDEFRGDIKKVLDDDESSSEEKPSGKRRSWKLIVAMIFATILLVLFVLFLILTRPEYYERKYGTSVHGLFSWKRPFETIRKRKMRCLGLISKAQSELDNDPDVQTSFYREDSFVTIPVSGAFDGIDAIYEYGSFLDGRASIFIDGGIQPDTKVALSIRMKGYDPEEDTCNFQFVALHKYAVKEEWSRPVNNTDPDFKPPAAIGSFACDVAVDYQEKYVKTSKCFAPKRFPTFFADHAVVSGKVYDFICDDVLNQTCGLPTLNCQERLRALPLYYPETGAITGDSLGCRAMHGAFASNNPETHCPHVSLEHESDDKGKVVCGPDTEFEELRQNLSEEGWEFYKKVVQEHGIDPDIGVLEEETS